MLKILVAVDGSECSERALWDLRRAGLPDKAEAVVLCVADDWTAQISAEAPAELRYTVPFAGFRFTDLSKEEAAKTAARSAITLRGFFPRWDIRDDPQSADSAAWKVIERIESWKPDLVAMGSHGRSEAERLLFGSVSHKVMTHVHGNLRICRGRIEKESAVPPLRILVAFDGSQESETAFETALVRHWPPGTAMRLITVADIRLSAAFIRPPVPVRYWMRANDKDPIAWVERMLADQKRHIQEHGWSASAEMLKGDPKRVLLKEAQEWGADTIFVGPRGLTGRQRIIAGSVSTALATHAHCSVEIVHRAWDALSCCDQAHEEHRDCMTRRTR